MSKQPTKMMRIREEDLRWMKELARRMGKSLPDLQRDFIKYYKDLK